MRILIIEDDRLVVRSLKLVLDGTGIEHEAVDTGEAGIELAKHHDYDVILLDLSLPDCHGYEVLRSLRKANIATPVMILTGISEVATKVTGFGFGADDYITKPFLGPELVARLHALVRRSQGRAQRVVTVGPMVVDLAARTVSVADRRVPLTAKEYAILELLALRKGVTLTKEMFLTHLYDGRDEPEMKIIDVFICKLRKKLADVAPNAARCIETVWGRGYSLRDPEVQQTVQVA